MKIIIDYNIMQGNAIFINEGVSDNLWDSLFQKLNLVFSNLEAKDRRKAFIPWRIFLRAKKQIKQFGFSYEIEIEYTDNAREGIKKSISEDYDHAVLIDEITEDELTSKLRNNKFERILTINQTNNLKKIANMPSAASFSVPGAGKTTEALSFFFYNSNNNDKLLVVAPKNALVSWDNELKECVPSCTDYFIRLQGGEDNISRLLNSNPRFMIITYQQLPKVRNLLSEYMIKNNTYLFLDESHRIKAGNKGIYAKTTLDLSILPYKKLILSGTPMPQCVGDLISQFNFLYPEKKVTEDNVVNLFEPIFVRTTANQLGIPPIKYVKVPVKMDTLQRNIYDALKSAVKRELEFQNLSDFSRDSLKRIGKSIIKVIQFVSNPSLLSMEMGYIFNQDLSYLLMKNDGAKLSETLKIARTICNKSEKVVIWSTFVQNVELIALRLSDLGANFIDGSVITGDVNDPNTREYRIDHFLHYDNCKVLVANPAACSESISLHKACHNAIYMDRSFNAAHFMQSEDRIHRLGLKQEPVIYIVECENSIDQVIEQRLSAKINNMADALNDPSIVISDYETNSEEDENEENKEDEVISYDDAQAIMDYFFKS